MKLTKYHLKGIQIELFYEQLNALENEEQELRDHLNIARNMACSEWDYGLIPSVSGGREGLRIDRTIPDTLELLRTNYDKLLEEISYRRYALIKAYYPVIKDRIGGKLKLCFDYWEKTNEIGKSQTRRGKVRQTPRGNIVATS